MDPRLLEHYDRELKYLRETAREFGDAYPALAGRLGVNAPGEADPYVERLLEGVAFMAARVQLKLADEFPSFTHALLEAVYPHYLAPSPSIAVLQFEPQAGEQAMADGVTIPRGSIARIATLEADRSTCAFSTAQPVALWPIKVTKVDYLSTRAAVAGLVGASGLGGESAFVIRVEAAGPAPLSALPIDELDLYLGGAESLAGRVYEQIRGHAVGVCAVTGQGASPAVVRASGAVQVSSPAFGLDAAALPHDPRVFRGYRLLQEYFACPERFLFVRLSGLRPLFRAAEGSAIDVVVVCGAVDKRLAGALGPGAFRPFCAPAINLFPKRCDPILLDRGGHEFRVVPDGVRQLDFEIYRLEEVYGVDSAGARLDYAPAYRADPRLSDAEGRFYAVRRAPARVATLHPRQRQSDYVGTDLWIALSSLPSARGTPDQIHARALCTNRDLPDVLRASGSALDFKLEDPQPVASVRAVLRPTKPRPPVAFEDARALDGGRGPGDRLWRLIGHLRPNYESLVSDGDAGQKLREHLALYARLDSAADRRAVDALTHASASSVVRRVRSDDALSFARGQKVDLTIDERNLPDGGAYLFAEIVDRFLSEFASLNAFVETHVSSAQRGPIARFGPRRGERPTI